MSDPGTPSTGKGEKELTPKKVVKNSTYEYACTACVYSTCSSIYPYLFPFYTFPICRTREFLRHLPPTKLIQLEGEKEEGTYEEGSKDETRKLFFKRIEKGGKGRSFVLCLAALSLFLEYKLFSNIYSSISYCERVF